MFKVTLEPSGHVYEVEDGVKLLGAGLKAGYYLPHSCRQGVCNSCKCKVIKGKVDYGEASSTYLTQDERQQGYALICQAKALSDVVLEVKEVAGMEDIHARVVPCRVLKIDQPAQDIAVLSIRLPMNENLLFIAGQYIEFMLENGQRRSYSIANAPSTEGVNQIELHLRRMPDGLFTTQVFTSLKPRALLTFEGPLGTFFIRGESDKPIILAATGTGFAPVKSMLQHAFNTRLNERRTIHFYWGARNLKDLYMLDLVRQWENEFTNFRFDPILSRPTPECQWSGRTGHISDIVQDDYADLSNHQVYACGSPGMIEAARLAFTSFRNLPADEFFADAFLPASNGFTETDLTNMP